MTTDTDRRELEPISEETNENKSTPEMPVKKEPDPPQITNPEGNKEENPKRT